MNRKIKLISMLFLMSMSLVACPGSNNSTPEVSNTAPELNGMFDRMPKVASTGVYNVMLNVTAYDEEDGNLTDKITYTIYDYDNKVEVDEIPLTKDNKFKVTYSVVLKDSKQEKEFIDEIRTRNGNLEVSLYEDSYMENTL